MMLVAGLKENKRRQRTGMALPAIFKKKFAGTLDQLQKPKGFIGPIPY